MPILNITFLESSNSSPSNVPITIEVEASVDHKKYFTKNQILFIPHVINIRNITPEHLEESQDLIHWLQNDLMNQFTTINNRAFEKRDQDRKHDLWDGELSYASHLYTCYTLFHQSGKDSFLQYTDF
jgi:hypothetical protein